jgi:hypothetical protein
MRFSKGAFAKDFLVDEIIAILADLARPGD